MPVRGPGRGALVGGFGDVVRSSEDIARVLALAAPEQQPHGWHRRDANARDGTRELSKHDVNYLRSVAATLAWVLGDCDEAPVSRTRAGVLTTKDLKVERVHAEDLIEQAVQPLAADNSPPLEYGEGVKLSIDWLLGYMTVPPTARR